MVQMVQSLFFDIYTLIWVLFIWTINIILMSIASWCHYSLGSKDLRSLVIDTHNQPRFTKSSVNSFNMDMMLLRYDWFLLKLHETIIVKFWIQPTGCSFSFEIASLINCLSNECMVKRYMLQILSCNQGFNTAFQ